MKLLMCNSCQSIIALSFALKECGCKEVSGKYREDGLHADVYMPNRLSGLVLGFANGGFSYAVNNQLKEGDSKELMGYAGGVVTRGRDFPAFIIPESAPTVHRHYHE